MKEKMEERRGEKVTGRKGESLLTACWRLFPLSPFLPFIFFTVACNTRPLPPADLSQGGWKVQQGQAVWRAKKTSPEIAGELFLATNATGRTVIQFTKTPFPFIIAQTATNSWQLEVPAQNRKYSGPGKPPARISWFHLPRALNGIVPPAPWVFQKLENENWSLENKSSGERIEGFLNQ